MKTKQVEHIQGNGYKKEYIRLYADEGKRLTLDGENLWSCVDVESINGWYEVDEPIYEDSFEQQEEVTSEDILAAMEELT